MNFHHGHYSKATHMFVAPKIAFAMINISYLITDCEGAVLKLRTWAIGTSSRKALKRWLRSRPDVDPATVEHQVVTESKWVERKRQLHPIGARIDVEDRTLESME